MSSDNVKGRITVKSSISEECWVEDWIGAINTFKDELTSMNNLKNEPISSSEKFRKLVDFKERYDMEFVPPSLIHGIFEPEIEKLENVHVSVNEDSLLLTAEHIEIRIRAGYNNGVFCADRSKYNFKRYQYKKPEQTHYKIAEEYDRLESGLISEEIFVSNLIKVLIDHHKLKDTKKSRLKCELDIKKTLKKKPEDLKNVSEQVNGYKLELEANELAESENKAREIRREKILRDTNLLNLLRSLHEAGLNVQRVGMTEDDFLFQ